jgi:urease accessory protein
MDIESRHLLSLLTFHSPAFPVGAFAYSHGLEWEIGERGLRDAAEIGAWIGAQIESGAAWNDAVLFSRCYDDNAAELNVLALALAGSAERYRETTGLGGNFRKAAAVWTEQPQIEGDIAYPVAAGAALAALGVPREAALLAFLHGACANLVSVAVRLVPLGQTAGLRLLRDLAPRIAATAARAASASLDDLGGNAIGAEIAAMRHETQQPRIFLT